MQILWNQFSDDQLMIVGITPDVDVDNEHGLISEREMAWPQILQPDRFNSEIVKAYNVAGIPGMYLIDPDGIIVAKDLRGEEMVIELERMISEYIN